MWSKYDQNMLENSCTSQRYKKNPILATLFNHEKSRIFYFQSRIQSSMHMDIGPAFNLIWFSYMYASKPWLRTRLKAAEITLSNSRIFKKTENLFLHPRLIQGVLTIQTYCRRHRDWFSIKFQHQSSRIRSIQFHGFHFWFQIVFLDSCAFNMFLWLFCIARDHTKQWNKLIEL